MAPWLCSITMSAALFGRGQDVVVAKDEDPWFTHHTVDALMLSLL